MSSSSPCLTSGFPEHLAGRAPESMGLVHPDQLVGLDEIFTRIGVEVT
jgi:hypothetical protein